MKQVTLFFENSNAILGMFKFIVNFISEERIKKFYTLPRQLLVYTKFA